MGSRSAAAAVAAIAFGLAPGVPAQARPAACDRPPDPGRTIAEVPYEDRLYDPARLAPLATGAGVRVAVLDSGVDDANPQLAGRVVAGLDLLRDSDGRQDCVGHGTGVAGIIAAAPRAGVGFSGLAPQATIVPVRVSEREDVAGKATGDPGNARDLARAVRWAASTGRADVINLSLTAPREGAVEICPAVAEALRRGVVVVAAAGNYATEGNPTPYPAACDGVIGVGAAGPSGGRSSYSQRGPYVDLVAVGDQVTTTAPGRGQRVQPGGTSFATPFVAATAALIRQRFPGSTPADVAERLRATADPAPGGAGDEGYGAGLLNPYRALTESLAPAGAGRPAPVVVHRPDPAVVALQARRARARATALVVAAGGAGLVVVMVVGALVLRRGRRRGWHPA